MSERTVVHCTFVIERTFPTPPGRVFAAFADPVRKRRWFAEGEGFTVDAFEMDFRVGGSERARFRFKKGAPLPEGTPVQNDSWYLDIVPDRRLVLASSMTVDGRRISSSLATFELRAAEKGTALVFTEQAAFFEGGDGPEVREGGWRQLLEQLALELAR